LEVAAAQTDLEDGGQPSTVASRHRGRERGVLDGVGVEGGQEAEQVRGVVHRHTVQQHQRLVRRPAANVETGGAFLAASNAGQKLDGFEDIGLTQQRRDRAGVLAGDRGLPRANACSPASIDHHLAQVQRHQGYIEDAGAADRPRGWLVPNHRDNKPDAVGGNRKAVAAERVGDGADPERRDGNSGGKRPSRFGVRHRALDLEDDALRMGTGDGCACGGEQDEPANLQGDGV